MHMCIMNIHAYFRKSNHRPILVAKAHQLYPRIYPNDLEMSDFKGWHRMVEAV